MKRTRRKEFGQGLLAGIGVALTIAMTAGSPVVITSYLESPAIGHRVDWLAANLGWSLVAFVPILVAYFVMLYRIKRLLDDAGIEVPTMRQAERVLTVCIGLFVATGVIFTAIGMRAALIYALGEPGVVAVEGAFAILSRMVDGGILLALSTTIVGGVGGKLMQLLKVMLLGSKLDLFYEERARHHADKAMSVLERIDAGIQLLAHHLGQVPVERGREARSEGRILDMTER